MPYLYRVLLVFVLLPFLFLSFIGCAPTLNYVEREVSIDKEEAANGWKKGNGAHRERERRLAADEIVSREVDVRAHKGYLVQIVNYSSDLVCIKVSRSGCFTPVTASFVMKPGSEVEYRLPAGEYDVHCSWSAYGGQSSWDDKKVVSTAPVFNNVSGKLGKYHAVIGNYDKIYCQRRGLMGY